MFFEGDVTILASYETSGVVYPAERRSVVRYKGEVDT